MPEEGNQQRRKSQRLPGILDEGEWSAACSQDICLLTLSRAPICAPICAN